MSGPSSQRRARWWAEPGPDTCASCLYSFHAEVGYYCADCDSPVCPVCVVFRRERHSALCPACKAAGGAV